MAPRKLKTDPEILEMPSQKMAVVYGRGDPNSVFPQFMPALYGSVYTLRFDRKKQGLPVFKVSGLRGRYPAPPDVAKDQWAMVIGLPVPEDVTVLPQKVEGVEVKLETWRYGTVAQVLHLGSYAEEDESVARLRAFIADSGYEIGGVHEEEYLSSPGAKVQKTIIRYPVGRKE